MMKNRTKRLNWDGGTLNLLAEEIQSLKDEYGGDATINIETWDGYSTVELKYQSPETETEEKQRLLWEEKRKQFRKKQYEDLKKEFEGT